MLEGYNMNNFWATRWAGLDEKEMLWCIMQMGNHKIYGKYYE